MLDCLVDMEVRLVVLVKGIRKVLEEFTGLREREGQSVRVVVVGVLKKVEGVKEVEGGGKGMKMNYR